MKNPAAKQLALHLKEFYYGKNWTWANMKEVLDGIDWIMAETKVESFNTISSLVYHVNYYLGMQNDVFKGGPLVGSDKLSFDVPSISSEDEWEELKEHVFKNADEWIKLVSKLDDEILTTNFVEKKYGTYYRNLLGAIEHSHYHLGQIVLLKKMLLKK